MDQFANNLNTMLDAEEDDPDEAEKLVAEALAHADEVEGARGRGRRIRQGRGEGGCEGNCRRRHRGRQRCCRRRRATVRKIEGPAAEPIELSDVRRRRRCSSACCRCSAAWCCCCSCCAACASSRTDADGRPPPASPSCSAASRRASSRWSSATTHGEPVVLRNAPFLHDGTPMPTRYWLVGRDATCRVSRLEADGGVRRAEAEVARRRRRRGPRRATPPSATRPSPQTTPGHGRPVASPAPARA